VAIIVKFYNTINKRKIALSPKNTKRDRPFRPNFELRTPTKETGFFTKSAISTQYLRKKPGFRDLLNQISGCARAHHENDHDPHENARHENARALHENARARGV